MTVLKRYKCIKSNDEKRFTVGEIYPLYEAPINYIVANNSVKWYEKEFPIIEQEYGVELNEMKEQIFDLNTLTVEELREYVELVGDKYEAEALLNDFIERMTK